MRVTDIIWHAVFVMNGTQEEEQKEIYFSETEYYMLATGLMVVGKDVSTVVPIYNIGTHIYTHTHTTEQYCLVVRLRTTVIVFFVIRSTAVDDFGRFRDDDVVGGGFVERVGHSTYL